MDDRSLKNQSIELLQQLGLKEYEAKSFVALARRDSGTAKDIAETSGVPRTRVYDAVRVLESKGLVEIQHSNPQLFRAVPVDEAVDTLLAEYQNRTDSLRDTLGRLDPVEEDEGETDVTHEVWALSSSSGIRSRTSRMIEGAEREVVLVVGDANIFTPELVATVEATRDRGVTVLLGAVSAELADEVQDAFPDIDVFVSGLEWLDAPTDDDRTAVNRLLLVDREAILVSSVGRSESGRKNGEKAVFGHGFDNGLVAITRRLMVTGLPIGDDPGEADA